MNRVLSSDYPGDPENTDFTLRDRSCWITVDSIAVYIHKTDEGVVVDLYPNGGEMLEPLAGTYAFFQEAEDAIREDAAI